MGEGRMAAVLSPQAVSQSPSPSALSPRDDTTSSQTDMDSLPSNLTATPARSQSGKAVSYASKRLSAFSTHSNNSGSKSTPRSRPASLAFPQFHSSLPYALVRDFAYPAHHPDHYGPQAEQPSNTSTPRSEVRRRLSDPEPAWERSESWESWRQSGEQLPQTTFGDHDGPPWSEDEDLQSPVVTSSKHRKNKSNHVGFDETRGRPTYHESRFGLRNGEDHDSRDMDGPQAMPHHLGPPAYATSRRDSHFATSLPSRNLAHTESQLSSSPSGSPDLRDHGAGDDDEDSNMEYDTDDNRYSRDYQFTIASPDEEMHGRAVALFDFASENDNELALVEGQVILISYRHGQGWLVAQDPKTGESGLVPEEYVRLLRDIEGGLSGFLNGWAAAGENNPSESLDLDTSTQSVSATTSTDSADARTPTQSDHGQHWASKAAQPAEEKNADGSSAYYAPVVSTFSTTREDFEPYHPSRLLGGQSQSQSATPTSEKAPAIDSLPGRKSGELEGRSQSPSKKKAG